MVQDIRHMLFYRVFSRWWKRCVLIDTRILKSSIEAKFLSSHIFVACRTVFFLLLPGAVRNNFVFQSLLNCSGCFDFVFWRNLVHVRWLTGRFWLAVVCVLVMLCTLSHLNVVPSLLDKQALASRNACNITNHV